MKISREELDALTESITRSVLTQLVDGGAQRLGLHADNRHHGGGLAQLIDHTLLQPDASEAQVHLLAEEAVRHGFATVCINPTWVRLASSLLSATHVGVCTVVGFPLGANTSDVKTYETRRALADGATEIDMVINIGALKSKDYGRVEKDIRGVVCCCEEMSAESKVIIEAALLDRQEKIKACTLAAAAGARFVKTSTGFGPGGATVEDVTLMRKIVGEKIGVKAAGGIRDAETAAKLIAAGATRIGASAGVHIVKEGSGAKK